MDSRTRFLTALAHEEPDRVPVFATLTAQVGEKLAEELGLPAETPLSRLSQRISHAQVLTHLGNDAVGVRPLWPRAVQDRWRGGELVADFGLPLRRIGGYPDVVARPLAAARTPADVEACPFPDPLEPAAWEFVRAQVSRYGGQYGLIGGLETTIFELSWNLVGLEKFLVDLHEGSPYVEALLDKVLGYNLAVGKRLVELGVDMVWAGDDFGTQRGMLVSPDLWRRFFKPRMQRLFRALKAVNPAVKIAYHSCGSILPIIPDLIEIGLDVLNPIQPKAQGMDLGALKKAYGRELAFFGGVDEQEVLPFGSPEEVEAEVRLRIRQAGAGGGFILGPAHNIQPDTPLQNVRAFFRAAREHGTYPLRS